MESPLQTRLRQRLDDLGLNALQAAKMAGLGPSFVRDILRGKTRSPSAENLQKLAVALETTPEYFSNNKNKDSAVQIHLDGLPVEGTIQAGAWLDTSVIDDYGDREIIPTARDQRFPRAKQYALAVVGDSMNLEFEDGTYVTCVNFEDSGLLIKPGRIVHVERHNGSLVEVTVKEISVIDGELCLVPKSTNPKHKPIRLEGDDGTEIVIKGVVIGTYKRIEV